jgi:hypothetical protein
MQQRSHSAGPCRFQPVHQHGHSGGAVALPNHFDQSIDGYKQGLVLAFQTGNRLGERLTGIAIAIEVVLPLPAQQNEHELPTHQPIRAFGEPVNSQVFARHQERLMCKDPLQDPYRFDWCCSC